jgi:geranylgeranyl pyrophosphate synthase
MEVDLELEKFKKSFDKKLEQFFINLIECQNDPCLINYLHEVKEYVLNGGKRLRPYILWKMISEQCQNVSAYDNVLIAFELLHNSTLIEDDIIDKHTVRRNRKTLPVVFNKNSINGEHLSLLVANLLKDKALTLILEAKISSQKRKDCLVAFNNISMSVNEGQVQDLAFRKNLSVNEKKLKSQVKLVSACFIGEMFKLGAMKNREIWFEVGVRLGVIFQMVDDLLDIDEKKYKGRELGSDLKMGKPTSLLIYTYNKLNKKDKLKFENDFGKSDLSADELSRIIKYCKKTGGFYCIQKYIDNEIVSINKLIKPLLISRNNWLNDFINYSKKRIN